VKEERVDERASPSRFSWRRMRIDPSILVDHGKIRIFKNNIERNILWHNHHLIDLPLDLDHIATIDFFILGKMLPIARYLPFFDHLLEIAAGFFGKKSRQVGVDSSGLSRVSQDAK